MSDIVTKLREMADDDDFDARRAVTKRGVDAYQHSAAQWRALADLVEAARKFHAACTTGSPLTWAQRVAEAHQDNTAALARLDGPPNTNQPGA